jgi:hypothetical protein
MQIRMTVTPKKGETHDATAEPQDLIAFEREFSKSVAKLQENIFLTDLFWLAWHVERRSKNTGLDFEEWVASVDDIGVAEEQDVVPLEPPPPTG